MSLKIWNEDAQCVVRGSIDEVCCWLIEHDFDYLERTRKRTGHSESNAVLNKRHMRMCGFVSKYDDVENGLLPGRILEPYYHIVCRAVNNVDNEMVGRTESSIAITHIFKQQNDIDTIDMQPLPLFIEIEL